MVTALPCLTLPCFGSCAKNYIPPGQIGDIRIASSPPSIYRLHSANLSSNPVSSISINSSNLPIHLPVCSCSFKSALLSFANKTVAVPALWPAVISSIESPTYRSIKSYPPHPSSFRHTIIKPSPPSSNSHVSAI